MPKVLITGGSDGIGRALCAHYAAQGWQVFATGRRAEGDIEPPLPSGCEYIRHDATGDPSELLNALPETLDAAILNAGAGKVGRPEEHTGKEIQQMIALNTVAPLLLAQALLPRLRGGTLAFIGSTAARGAHGDFSVYAATKAALDGAARALALEWDGRVNVLMIHPGPTATGMHDKAGLGDIAARRYFTSPAIVARSIAASVARGRNARMGPLFTLRHAFGGRP
ncbi:MAG: SDR family oxidoreductase [Pseudomonadota bacterium]